MIKEMLILLGLLCLNGCSAATFDKGLNYKKTSGYSIEYHKDTQYTSITNQKNGNHISIAFHQNSCGFYGLIGPLIFPIIPIWENDDCKDVVIGIGAVKNVSIIYRNKIYEPIKISVTGGYFFPIPIKSITDTAILVVEEKNGQKFEIPFRYQHTFSFDLWPGR